MHELPLHPLTITNLLLKPVETVVLPMAEAGLDVAEVIKDPGFSQWILYLLVAIYVLEKIGGGALRLMGVSLPAKREITGKMITSAEKEHADQTEVDELKAALQALREENRAQHMQASTAGSQRVMALSEVVDSETAALSDKVDAVRDKLLEKIEEGFVSIHDKLNAVALKSERHDALLPPLVVRVNELERKHSEAVGKIHERINDFISKHPTQPKR